jgi:hypothetical protein
MKFTFRSPLSPDECIESLMQAALPEGSDGASYRLHRSRSRDRFRAALFRRPTAPRGARVSFVQTGPLDVGAFAPHSVLKVRCRVAAEGASVEGRVGFDGRTRAMMFFSYSFLVLFAAGVGASALIQRSPSKEWLPFLVMGVVMGGIAAFVFGAMQTIARPDKERLRDFVRMSTQGRAASTHDARDR